MTEIDFRQLARAAVGDEGWSKLDETERRAAMRVQKVAWLNRTMGGPATRETYAEWLAAQPREVQDRILGPTRARLFRDGGLAIERFTDMIGRPLTLEQLALSRPEAFTRAGLDPADFQEG
jgi:hypothetical protein